MLKSQFFNHPDREPANRNFFDNDFEPIRFSVNSMAMKPIKSQLPISESFVKDIRSIIERGRKQAYDAAGAIMFATYWEIGRRIVEEEQNGNIRAQYGKQVIAMLANNLKNDYGSSYGQRNLAYYRQFYLSFSDLSILHTRVQNLTWSHIRRVLSVSNADARAWYLNSAAEENWSVRTLSRNISSQYYERRLAWQRDNDKESHDSKIVVPYHDSDPMEYIKNPTIAEFMGFHRDTKYSESQLEQALIDNLEKFILELGRGFAFVERQQHITTDLDEFYIDLVFYNFRMKRFVIFELKTHKMTHADIGQLDMYVRMYDDLIKNDDDNPTIGVLLCTDTDSTIAKYSVLNESQQLFASKYMPFMPTEEELRHEIEQQKRFFLEHHKE